VHISQYHHQSPPPAVAYICRKARVSQAHAIVIASLAGLPTPDGWEFLSVPAAQAVASLAWRGRA
jgi:hypothetical protein